MKLWMVSLAPIAHCHVTPRSADESNCMLREPTFVSQLRRQVGLTKKAINFFDIEGVHSHVYGESVSNVATVKCNK